VPKLNGHSSQQSVGSRLINYSEAEDDDDDFEDEVSTIYFIKKKCLRDLENMDNFLKNRFWPRLRFLSNSVNLKKPVCNI
jgi:hypothetical protein